MLKKVLKNNNYRNNIYHEENQYLNLINDIIDNNEVFEGRNGKTLSVFGSAMYFSLENNKIPLLTTKKLAIKTCLKELLWFIKGDTNNKNLKDQKVHIWDANSSRSFLDSRGLTDYNEDDCGPIYGFQWRHFNADYKDCNTDYDGYGIDQLNYIISQLKNSETRNSRRLIMSAWNPCQIDKMALPPCHVMCQFNVTNNNKLSCSLYQRSGDVGLGIPFNIASYSFLTHLIAKHCNLEGYEFVYYLGNAHIYDDHIEALKIQKEKIPYNFPTLQILNKYENIEEYKVTDFKINDYNCHSSINLLMRE